MCVCVCVCVFLRPNVCLYSWCGCYSAWAFHSLSHSAVAPRLFLYTKRTLKWATLAKRMNLDLMSFVFMMYRWWHGHSRAKRDSDPCNGASGLLILMLVTVSDWRCVQTARSVVWNTESAYILASRSFQIPCLWSATQAQGSGLIARLGLGPVTNVTVHAHGSTQVGAEARTVGEKHEGRLTSAINNK